MAAPPARDAERQDPADPASPWLCNRTADCRNPAIVQDAYVDDASGDSVPVFDCGTHDGTEPTP